MIRKRKKANTKKAGHAGEKGKKKKKEYNDYLKLLFYRILWKIGMLSF